MWSLPPDPRTMLSKKKRSKHDKKASTETLLELHANVLKEYDKIQFTIERLEARQRFLSERLDEIQYELHKRANESTNTE